MKNYIVLVLISLVSMTSISQNIDWEKDYPTALKKAQKEKKALVIYFNDGSNPTTERVIKKSIFKSKEFKTLSKKSVGLLIDSPENNEKYRYNRRVTLGNNPYKIFPALKVINFGNNKSLPLLKEFETSDIELFLTQLKTLQK